MEKYEEKILPQLGLDMLNDMLPCGFIVIQVEPEVHFIFANNIMLEMLGFEEISEAEIQDVNSIFSFIHPEDANHVFKEMRGNTNRFTSHETSFRIRKKNNDYLWVKLRSQHKKLEDGVEVALAFFIDVSDEVEAKAKSIKQLKYQKQLFDSLASGILRYQLRMKERDTVCVYANEASLRIHGIDHFPEGKFDGKYYIYHVIYPEDRKKMVSLVFRMLKGSTQEYFEHRIVRFDGKTACIRGSISIIEDENGQQLYQVVYDDVTEQRNILEEREQNEESLKAAVAHSDMEFWEYDFKKNKALVGDRSRKVYALETEIENFPETFVDLNYIHPDDVEEYLTNTRRVKQGERYLSWNARLKNATSNRYEWKNIRYTTIFDKYHEPVKGIATAQNIDSFIDLENRLNLTLNQNGIWTWDYDMENHRIINYNYGKGDDLAGFHSEIIENVPEIMVENRCIHEDYIEVFLNLYERINAGEKHVVGQIRGWSEPQKEYRWFELSFSVVEDRDGKPVKAMCSSRDIEAMKQMEQQYRYEVEHRKEISATLMVTSRVNLTKNKVEGIIENDNSLSINLSEVSTDYKERMGRILDDIRLTDEENQELSPDYLLMQYMKGKINFSKEYMAWKKNTDILVWVHVDIHLLKSPDTGDIIAFYYNHDLTEKYIESATNSTILKYDYELIGLIIVKNRHVYLSSEMKNSIIPPLRSNDYDDTIREFILRYGVEEEMDQLIDSLMMSTIQKQLEKVSVYAVEYDLREEDGRIRRKRIRFAYADEGHEMIALTRTDVEDILQEEKQKQEQLATALDLAEQASIAKTDFLARISHEIRTPMNVIMGLTALTADEAEHPEIVRDYLEKIDVSSRHLLNLINDVLDMSKIESGEFTLHPEKYTYEEMQMSLKSVILPLCEQKNIKLILKGNLIHRSAMIDRVRLSQVFINLLNNSIKFTPENGTIEVVYDNFIIGKMVDINARITDSGIGMTKEFQQHMFEPFTQESNKVVSSVQGTGLGLSIVKGIMDKMGGTIDVESNPGEGTTFIIHFQAPLAEDESLDNPKVSAAEVKFLKEKTVLVVEDHPMNQMIVKRLLEKKDIHVICAENGVRGVSIFEESTPGSIDMILMDIRMPLMDGLSATKVIRELNREDAKTIPIIAMTANAYDEDREKSKQAGMNKHLSKPIEPQILYQTLEEFLR